MDQPKDLEEVEKWLLENINLKKAEAKAITAMVQIYTQQLYIRAIEEWMIANKKC